MNLAIFGGTGRLGSIVVNHALEAGHVVTILVRDENKVANGSDSLTTKVGNVLNPADVKNAIEGQDAVISTLGDGRKGVIRAAGTRVIVEAMENSGVKRLISESTLGVGSSAKTLNFFWKYVMFGAFLRKAFADHVEQERIVEQSSLDWTLVRPSAFTDGPRTGKYQHGTLDRNSGITLKISCEDIADFILKELENSQYLRKTPGLSY